jgi:hypothetical protein
MTISKRVYWPRTELGIYKYMGSATIELYSIFHISHNIFLISDRPVIICLLLFMVARVLRGREGLGKCKFW